MDETKLNFLIQTVVRELSAAGVISSATTSSSPAAPGVPPPVPTPSLPKPVQQRGDTRHDLVIDLPDPTLPALRYKPGVINPHDPEALQAMVSATIARIGVGRAGPRYRTSTLLLFQADHAVTQDALMRDVDQSLLDEFNLFTVNTRISGSKKEYLMRPDLGRRLSDEAKRTIAEKCVINPTLQICIGDGLSAAAIEANLRKIFPVLKQGAQSTGMTFGTPFFIKGCRVGVLNDLGDLIHPQVLVLLIGERPGLGRAESMSAYMAYHPKTGDSDADRDLVCNIFENGGTNPLEAGAVVIQMAQNMIQHQSSGVKLKMAAP
jgi:ethanolamine ammonia-lyase small subunit